MKIVHTETPDQGIALFSEKVSTALNAGRKVLWLLCGGSNIPISTTIMDEIRESVDGPAICNLTIAFTDERYGPVDHVDSNAKQLADSGFKFEGVTPILPLIGRPLEQTVTTYDQAVTAVMHETEAAQGLVIAQFGIGADGHIAGIMPHSPAVTDTHLVAGYLGEPFTRITLTPKALRRIPVAFAFVFGEPKKLETLKRLRDGATAIDDQPCQILKELPEAALYTDII